LSPARSGRVKLALTGDTTAPPCRVSLVRTRAGARADRDARCPQLPAGRGPCRGRAHDR